MADNTQFEKFVGLRSGKLVVTGILPDRVDGKVTVTCKCDCGRDKVARLDHIRDNRLKSCGQCGYAAMAINKRCAVDLTGKMSGWLKPLRPTTLRNASYVMWECECTRPGCGRHVLVSSGRLTKKVVKSCGKCGYREEITRNKCAKYKTEDEKHLGLSIFPGMIRRCYNPTERSYENYGAKGIRICNEWLKDRTKFVRWAIDNGYKRGLSIDRIDPLGDYCPENCRWATFIEQENNRSDNRRVTFNGVEHTCSEWARIYEINPNRLYVPNNSDIIRMLRLFDLAKKSFDAETYKKFTEERSMCGTTYLKYFGDKNVKVYNRHNNPAIYAEGIYQTCARWDAYFLLPVGYMRRYVETYGLDAAKKMVTDRLAGRKPDHDLI